MAAAIACRTEPAEGKSELLRGIPDFRKKTSNTSLNRVGAVNPVPAAPVQKDALARNGHELARELRRRQSAEDKVRWLADIPGDAYAKIFRVEIDAELLQTMLAAMHATVCKSDSPSANSGDSGETWTLVDSNGDEKKCVDGGEPVSVSSSCRITLTAISRNCPRALRFAASFAGVKERARIEELLAALAAAGGETSVEELTEIRAGLLNDGAEN